MTGGRRPVKRAKMSWYEAALASANASRASLQALRENCMVAGNSGSGHYKKEWTEARELAESLGEQLCGVYKLLQIIKLEGQIAEAENVDRINEFNTIRGIARERREEKAAEMNDPFFPGGTS